MTVIVDIVKFAAVSHALCYHHCGVDRGWVNGRLGSGGHGLYRLSYGMVGLMLQSVYIWHYLPGVSDSFVHLIFLLIAVFPWIKPVTHRATMADFTVYSSPQLLLLTLSASLVALIFSYSSRYTNLKWPSKTKEGGSKAVRALPASWYLSQEMYELERRAIFSKKWLLTTHKHRLPNPGDWLRYEVAGFDFVIAKDRTGAINAFHNVCRHRAFPVVTKDQGNNSILACKYHNWSYALNGKLTKAPNYQELEGFDKSQNGLFPIHVHIDTNGFIWVNLESAEKPATPWEADYKDIDKQERFKAYNFEDYKFDHTWQMEGEYNWKLLGDNYNECYHCPTTHPDIPSIADLDAYKVVTEKGYVQHLGNPTAEQIARGFNVAATFYFPNASMNVS